LARLKKLNKRMNTHQQQKRQVKIQARSTVAEAIIASQRQFGGVLQHFFTRGFWGRLNWLLTGR
jgi:hypothetical protein